MRATGRRDSTGTEDGDLGADRTTTARVIALVNQKGGCGKTTTAVNLAACLAVSKRRVLLIDLDPQANATVSLGIDPASLTRTMYNILVEDTPGNGQSSDLASIVVRTNVPNLELAPSTIDLAAAELELSSRIGRENTLRKKVAPLRERYEYILIDSPPSLGLLTLNALVACNEVIIPIQTHYYALLGMRQLLRTLKAVREEAGHEVEIAGVVPTMYDARTSVGKEILQGIRDYFGEKVFSSAIHFNIKLVESSMVGVPVFVHQPTSRGAAEYMSLAKEVMALEQKAGRAPARN
ncbi:MAG TPA: ParA family protein [bacterium]|nr:ParA family protein [bacterium]